jgi:2,3-bisphosphoglycerate-independent phosphoglycerate mutase
MARGIAAGGRKNARLIVTGDHTTPVAYAEHTCEPVPCVVGGVIDAAEDEDRVMTDCATRFEETNIGMHGHMGRFPGLELMELVKYHARRR